VLLIACGGGGVELSGAENGYDSTDEAQASICATPRGILLNVGGYSRYLEWESGRGTDRV